MERTKRVLVIEDNENNIYLITFILKKNGYDSMEARDGAAGVEMALKEKPDLILMDMQLPVLDGYEATKRIKAMEETRGIPVIAITSFAMVGDKEKALGVGCDGYIEKPINPVTIMTELKKYLDENENK